MSAAQSHAGQSAPPPRAAVYSLCGAAGVCIILVTIWWSLRPRQQLTALQRRLADVTVTWACINGHTFEQAASPHGCACTECGAASDVSVAYRCPTHGRFSALVRYTRTASQRERVDAVSFNPPAWRSVSDAIRCPKCGTGMQRRRR